MADLKSLSSKKVAGVPVLYLIGGFVAIMAVIAWRMKPSTTPADAAAADSAATDAASASGSNDAVPPVISGTVVAAPSPAVEADVPYEDNSTWLRKAVAFLIAHGSNPGDAQLAMQHYLSGASLSYAEGQMRDSAVRELGLPPNDFDAGTTAGKPTTPAPTPAKSPTPVTPVAKPPVKAPAPPKPAPPPVKSVIVQRGDTLSGIAARNHTTWQRLYAYAPNRSIIGPNPNLIKPGQRIVIV